jgi:hypothetical protein
VLLVLATGCTPGVKIHTAGRSAAAREPNCPLRVYELEEIVDREYEVLGDIYIHDTGFTVVKCGEADVRARVRQEACRMGADAVEIYRETHPMSTALMSTCYRVKARFLRFTDEETPLEAEPESPKLEK